MIELLCNSAATAQTQSWYVLFQNQRYQEQEEEEEEEENGQDRRHTIKPSLNPYAPLNRISFSFYSTAPAAAAAAAAAAAVMNQISVSEN
ncbi:hypothetical protein SDJN02_06330, partial [Cucurbita argyrosperma subsp. argyrosperma]